MKLSPGEFYLTLGILLILSRSSIDAREYFGRRRSQSLVGRVRWDTNPPRERSKFQCRIKVGNLAVVYVAVQHPAQWYVATGDGTLIFGPFSSLGEAMEVVSGTSSPGSASEKGS